MLTSTWCSWSRWQGARRGVREVKGEVMAKVMGEVMAKVMAEVGREHRPGADARGPCIVYEDERMAIERGKWNGEYNEF